MTTEVRNARPITTKFRRRMQNDIPVAIGQNRNWKWNSNMAAVHHLKLDIVLSQPWT